MHKLIFYPVGNGDTSQIILENGKRLLFDFRHQNQGENDDKPHIDLKKRLRGELEEADRDDFDVVAFTHGDQDHISHSTEFFELLHADKYQGDDRIKIKELWVPAAMILETATNDKQSNEFIIWRREARHRLKEGKGIQVFSKPDKLKNWLDKQGLTVESRKHLITDAGTLAKGFSIPNDGVEFFCHSPFIKHCDEGDDMRNSAALIFQVRFDISGTQTDYLAVGDSEYSILEDIVDITQYYKRNDRLNWDIFNIPHHCSYLALSSEKGAVETIPTDKIKILLRNGQQDAYLISSSNPISDNKDAYEQQQPPHIQAKKAYKRYLDENGGREILVTMEEPNENNPEPIIFEITANGCNILKKSMTGSAAIISSTPPRAG